MSWQIGKIVNFSDAQYENFLLQFPVFVSGLIFVFLYVIVTFFAWLAKDILKIVAAILFGAYISTFLIWIAEMINAAVLFYFSRTFGKDFVQGILKGKARSLNEKIGKAGFWGLFVLRAFPLVPFRFLDLAAGLTKTSFWRYFILVVFASPVRIFWIQFILSGVGVAIVKDPTVLIRYLSENELIFVLSFVYLVISIVFVFLLRKKHFIKQERKENG